MRATLEVAVKTLRFFAHETLTHHDPRVTRTRFLHGRRLLTMECDCGAEWTDIDVSELPELRLDP